jgi:hypothetical protein
MKINKISLKQLILSFVFFLLSFQLSAQTDSLVNLPNLLLPRFTKSIVKLKSGETKTAVLNYNKVDQQMVFMQQKQPMILDNPQLIDTIFMANRTFVPFEKGFYELLVVAPIKLFRQNKSYVEFEGSPTLYGAKSQTTSPSGVSQIYASSGPINLKVPQGYKVVDDSQFWVHSENGMKIFDTKREFLKIFPEKEKELSQFISKYKISFEKSDDVIRLINYTNEIYR